MKKLLLVAICLPACLAVSFASPLTTVVFDNTGQTTDAGYWATWPAAGYAAEWGSFTVPNDFVVTSVELVLDNNIGSAYTYDPTGVATTNGVLTVSISEDNGAGGIPGTSLGSIGSVQDSSIPGDGGCTSPVAVGCTFSLVNVSITPEALSGGTYWLGLSDSSAPSNPAILWGFNNAGTGVDVASESTYDTFDGLYPNTAGAYQMQIEGYVAPEPATGAFGLIGLVALLTVYRRRRAVS
jgi:hypothetical protein